MGNVVLGTHNYWYVGDGGCTATCEREFADSESGSAEYRGLDEFCRRNPIQFQGEFALDAAIEWVKGLERIFRAMRCSDAKKVPYATYMLVKEAENWWEMVRLEEEEGDGILEVRARECDYGGIRGQVMFFHQEIYDFPTLINKCRMYEDDVRVRDIAAGKMNVKKILLLTLTQF
ncbi:hypothetical protein Lal_00031454 [Lupinus albus]|nr:hypothetical protein Lal_00031454 [Lupinus albus]